MSVFTSENFDRHESLIFKNDEESGLKAIIAIHNTVRGPALGGCRMWPYATEEEAISDALRLSRGMTYKSAMVDLSYGGGKAVIIGDPKRDKSEKLLRSFGRMVESLAGRYYTGEDVGMTVPDMDIVAEETNCALGLSDGTGDPSKATSFGVLKGIQAAMKFKYGRDDLKGVRVAVQGLGNVGFHLCEYLNQADASLVVTDIDPAKAKRVAEKFEAVVAEPDKIHSANVDVFSPCALGAIINDQSLPEIRASIIAGSANNQLAEPHHGEELMAKDILYAPDYVVNAGGLIDVANVSEDYDAEKTLDQVARIYDRLLEIFAKSVADGQSTASVADSLAEERFVRNELVQSEAA